MTFYFVLLFSLWGHVFFAVHCRWIGSYGGEVGNGLCDPGHKTAQLCKLGPFVGFRSSVDSGITWEEPTDKNGHVLTTSKGENSFFKFVWHIVF